MRRAPLARGRLPIIRAIFDSRFDPSLRRPVKIAQPIRAVGFGLFASPWRSAPVSGSLIHGCQEFPNRSLPPRC